MTDYAWHLTQMNKIQKQMRDALLKNQFDMAYNLSVMLEKETRFLRQSIGELKREMESRMS